MQTALIDSGISSDDGAATKMELMPDPFAFLNADSAMCNKARLFDWDKTSLGAPAAWPAELVSAASQVLESHFPAALVWGPDLITLHNDAFLPILGAKGDVFGRPFSEIWAEVWDEIGPIAARAFAGEATFIEDFPLTIDRHGYPEQAWFTFCYSPVRLADGTVGGMLDTVFETSQTVIARQRADVLNAELIHRLKNAMSMVQAIAMQSLRTVRDREPVDLFLRRVLAMAKAHDVLRNQDWQRGSIRQVVTQALSLHEGRGQIRASGKDMALGSKAVLSLSLLLHELATNATKYGALSTPEGKVTLDWRIEREGDEDMVTIDWREEGGPPVTPPKGKGFGSRLIGMGLAGNRAVEMHYAPEGLQVTFRAPLRVVQEDD